MGTTPADTCIQVVDGDPVWLGNAFQNVDRLTTFQINFINVATKAIDITEEQQSAETTCMKQ